MLWICDNCTTAYSPGAPRCPHCGATDYHEQGAEMPKNTRARGATNAAAGVTGDEPTTEAAPEAMPEPDEEGEDDDPDPPAKSAGKADWVTYARFLGADDDTLAGSKADLQEWAANQ